MRQMQPIRMLGMRTATFTLVHLLPQGGNYRIIGITYGFERLRVMMHCLLAALVDTSTPPPLKYCGKYYCRIAQHARMSRANYQLNTRKSKERLACVLSKYCIINYPKQIGAAPEWIKLGERDIEGIRPLGNCPLHAFEEE
jgi:hypothetical protein